MACGVLEVTSMSSDFLMKDWVADQINSHGLLDLPLHLPILCGLITNRPVMSHLDKFLVSADWAERYPDVVQIELPEPMSDHCPVLLDTRKDS